MTPCLNLAAVSKSYLFSACSKRNFSSSIFDFNFLISSFIFFSLSHASVNVFSSLFNLVKLLSISSILFLDNSSFSFFIASFSISKRIIFLVSSSSLVGTLSICTLIVAHASSTKSIALSGKYLSVIYLLDKVAALISALSCIVTPWCISNLSFKPRNIVIVSSTLGSLTIILWNLLSSAPSFSIYFLYSFNVVAPITWISPLASIGFNMLLVSIAPSTAPVPTIVWISSINIIILPSDFFTSLSTFSNLSSNSPLYLAPAIKEAILSSHITLSFKERGTSPFTILSASPSTIAVLPTPGSPIRTGLFFVFLDKIRVIERISSSLPITGSIFLFLTSSFILRPYFSSTFSSSFWLYIFITPYNIIYIFWHLSIESAKKLLHFYYNHYKHIYAKKKHIAMLSLIR